MGGPFRYSEGGSLYPFQPKSIYLYPRLFAKILQLPTWPTSVCKNMVTSASDLPFFVLKLAMPIAIQYKSGSGPV